MECSLFIKWLSQFVNQEVYILIYFYIFILFLEEITIRLMHIVKTRMAAAVMGLQYLPVYNLWDARLALTG